MSEEFQHLLRAEMERVEASPRADLVREAHQRQRRRQRASRRAGQAATGCVAAVVAVVTVIAVQSGGSRLSTSAATGSSAQATAPVKVNLGGAAAAVQTTAAPVTVTLTAETGTTAAAVLDAAARASGSGNVQLVNGWPAAPYWHTLSQQTSSSCPGQVITTNTWLGKDGTEITGDQIAGPKSSDSTSSCYDPGTGYSPVIGAPSGITIGKHRYSWAQFAALPTDPAKLWPLLRADANPGGAPSEMDLYTAYWYIVTALTSDPIAPAMRMALFKVMAKFPSVHVTGKYTDSLGRTGTAITFTLPNQADGGPMSVGGSFTDVIDAGTGQVLAQLDAAQPIPAGCVRATVAGVKGASCAVSGAGVRVFISAGPASTTPLHLAKYTMPSVVGDSVAQAERKLAQAGIRSITLKGGKLAPRSNTMTGTVITQSPAAGATITSAQTPTLTLRS